MSQELGSKSEKNGKINNLKVVLFGIGIGVILTGLIILIAMPKMMITVYQSRYSTIEETCSKLKESIQAHGWSSPMTRNLNATLAKNGIEMKRPVRVVELCKGAYANDILQTNPEVSTLMPCAWGVYEGNDGKIYISGMNMGLMGKMFGGNIAKIIGGSVAIDEKNMLKDIILQ
ncbi:MAG: DUF302 domain-containing protein [Candidatus Omnitrophica bacterium]|nr:DUF302 domain-containing protein [Candidatus Omnitrophota bacterium]